MMPQGTFAKWPVWACWALIIGLPAAAVLLGWGLGKLVTL